jgi:hypothetical protein
MLGRYHEEITRRILGKFFTPKTLKEIVRANIAQDTLPSLFGAGAHRHVCDCTVAHSLDYIAEEHAQIAELAQMPGREQEQRAALGRLLHTAQDFYAHTNYVALWLAEKGEAVLANLEIDLEINLEGNDGLESHLWSHEHLQIAQWTAWREPLYYVPVIGNLMRWIWLPEASHEAIHLDSPDRGPRFQVAMAIAQQRTHKEYAQAVATIRRVGGTVAVALFHGTAQNAPLSNPHPALAHHVYA